MTYREVKVIERMIHCDNWREALRAAGFSEALAAHPSYVITDEMRQALAKIQAELVANTLQAGLIDATEIHEYITDALRADMRDIRNDDGSFKPQSEWPEIWGRMMEAGDVEVEYESVRSHDGVDGEGKGGWDTGGAVRKVKLKFASRTKLLELAMKHKGVNAMVEARGGDIHLHLHEQVTAKLQAALVREQKVIEIEAKEVTE